MTVVRPNPGGLDAYGDPTSSTETRTAIAGAVIAPIVSPLMTDRITPGRSATIVGYSLFVPPGTDIRTSDYVEIAGVKFKIDGQIGEWTNPFTGNRRGLEARLRRVEG